MSARNLLRTRQSGQTLIVALLILGVLLIMGSLFLGFISRGIVTTQQAQQRSVATDLAEAGIRYSHSQLVNSQKGADWRPPVALNVNPRDPDFAFLQPGGPDGQGAYSRLDMSQGRALVRVRYAPSDTAVFTGAPNGNLRTPGRVRGYLILESVGRSGNFNPSDPTTVIGREKAQERKLIAFASIGLIDQARFITNINNVSRPAEIGIPSDMGSVFGVIPVDALELQLGMSGILYNKAGTPTINPVVYGGGLRCNDDIVIHGIVNANINTYLGDQWLISGTVKGADANSVLRLSVADYNPATNNYVQRPLIALQNNTVPSLDSRSAFSTNGVIRDGIDAVDTNGVPRRVRREEPASILVTDPQTGETRYVGLTRESGVIGPGGNDGNFGYGRNPYIDNTTDLQIANDEASRTDLGTAENLVYDWLNPNNGGANTGWKGPFYIPTGAYMNLWADGFTITRNSQAINGFERTWKNPDGSDTGSPTIRYRLGAVTGQPQPYIVNTFTPGVNINGPLTTADFAKGQPFDGVVYFAGNVRVRGVIPTDVQMTIVSGGSIYIEGSITKGVIGTNWTSGRPVLPGSTLQHNISPGTLLDYPSRSMLMLMARQYVAVNTTQFLGAAAGQTLDVKDGDTLSAVRLPASGGLISLKAEFLLNPDSGTNGSSITWTPYGTTYIMTTSGGTSSPLSELLMVKHSMDDGGGAAPASFVSLDVNNSIDNSITGHTNDWNFLFPVSIYNSVFPYEGANWTEANHSPGLSIVEGIGDQAWQRFAKFESVAFPFIDNTFQFPAPASQNNPLTILGRDNGLSGSFVGFLQDTNDVSFRPNNQFGVAAADYLLARAAIVPLDVRIEASVYAQEGSFFVIPGPAYNSDPNDRRDVYNTEVQNNIAGGMTQAQARDAADVKRLQNFGAFPATPFYQEPLDVKVNVIGSVSENMPPPMSQQAEWLKLWAWIPRFQGAARNGAGADLEIPVQHIPGLANNDPRYVNYVPNIVITYDQALAAGRVLGFNQNDSYIRTDASGRPLPPMPRLPVSPTLSYFGEVNP